MSVPVIIQPPAVLDFDKINLPSTTHKEENVDSTITKIAKYIFWSLSILVDPVIDFFTQGLSDFLGLETLRHGTSLKNYLSIRVNGADPTRGGTGASVNGNDSNDPTQNSVELSKGRTYYAKDNEAYVSFMGKVGSQIFNRILSSRLYCAFSSYTPLFEGNRNLIQKIVNVFVNTMIILLSMLFVPIVKLRAKPEDVVSPKFQNDPENSDPSGKTEDGLAYFTFEKTSTENIGFLGIVNNGLSGDIGKRMSLKPGKTVWGLIRLINPIGIVMLGAVGLVIAKKKIFGE